MHRRAGLGHLRSGNADRDCTESHIFTQRRMRPRHSVAPNDPSAKNHGLHSVIHARPVAQGCALLLLLHLHLALAGGGMAGAVRSVTLRLTPTTRLVLRGPKADLTTFDGDAVVNAANERMLGGGGVDGALHRAAGPQLLQACRQVPEVRPGVRCPTGEARITPGAALAARHVIHTVGPVYHSAAASAPLLESAYRASLRLANAHGLKTVAFPAISCGVFGYPHHEAAEVALRTCRAEAGGLQEVHFFFFDSGPLEAWLQAAEAAELPREEL